MEQYSGDSRDAHARAAGTTSVAVRRRDSLGQDRDVHSRVNTQQPRSWAPRWGAQATLPTSLPALSWERAATWQTAWPSGTAPHLGEGIGLPRSGGDHTAYLVAKRVFDVLIASVALLVLAPLFVLIALAIRLESAGPVLYRQQRVGQASRRFTMDKFRTMRPDRRKSRGSIHFAERRRALKSAEDPRVTRIGALLRRTSLDELPQLFNVWRGEMSLVGPRPEQPEMLEYYGREHYQRHLAVPGLTGWWQINGRCGRGGSFTPMEDLHQKLTDDRYYLEHQSFWFDLWVLVQTIPVVLSRRGAL